MSLPHLRIVVGVLSLLALVQLVICLAAPVGARPRGSAVRSIALTVADLEEARGFFVSGLGFTAVGAPIRLAGAEYAGLTGIRSAEARRQRLTLGQEQIELLAFSAPPGRAAPGDGHSDALWFQHLALVASDIDRAQERVAQLHALPISSGVQTIPRANPAAGGIRAFYFHGPAQHPLELIWFPLGKGMPRWQSKAAPLLGIDHTAITVADSERSRAFYADLLGLHVVGHSLNFGREQVDLSGVPDARVAITGLRGAEGPGVEFLEYRTPQRGRPAPPDTRANDLWHWETTIAVPDLDRTLSQLRAVE
jgi:catechol 2,3-dioxygenase-like lactoylglutathione lyase family enzyme